jgi:hypothetical protein
VAEALVLDAVGAGAPSIRAPTRSGAVNRRRAAPSRATRARRGAGLTSRIQFVRAVSVEPKGVPAKHLLKEAITIRQLDNDRMQRLSCKAMSNGSSKTSPEASGPAAGYYFQIRYALARALERLTKNPTASISIEKLDDVAIEYESGEADLEQLKHSLDSGKVYNDPDKAVWRTLGNWSKLYASGDPKTQSLRLFLTTNGRAADGSALALLGPERTDADVDAALEKLLVVAGASTNKDTAKDREDFINLPSHLRKPMVAAVTFVEDSPNLAGMASEIEEALGYVCQLEERPRFRNEIEGWWFDRVMGEWTKGSGATIPLLELEARITFLRERYKAAALVIDVADQVAMEPLDGRLFVRQVKAVNVGSGRIQNVQRDYLKASAQRSKWLREFKVDPAELTAYDAALAERWDTRSEILKDELSPGATEESMCGVGRTLLAWAEEQEVPIRSARAQFLTSGSYHALADVLRIGWHPDFAKRFSE